VKVSSASGIGKRAEQLTGAVSSAAVKTLSLSVLGASVSIHSADRETRRLLTVAYGSMRAQGESTDLTYRTGKTRAGLYFCECPQSSAMVNARRPVTAADGGEFLWRFDEAIAIGLQKRRADLYFLHAAVLGRAGQAIMLVAAPGGGKSTTTWGMLHHGFSYLSDELAPVDLKSLVVYPLPRALCLKDDPSRAYPLPTTRLFTSRSIHVPTESLPGRVVKDPLPLGAVFFLRQRTDSREPLIQRVSGAEAAMRLYTNALNPLAHPEGGLDGAIRIATGTVCFELLSGDLTATCALLTNIVDELLRERTHRCA
jgi:hypothetical protein